MCEESHKKSKTSSSLSPSSSRPSSSRPSVGKKRRLEDYSDSPSQKRSRSSSLPSPSLSELFANRNERLHDSQLTSLPGFMAQAVDSVFYFINQTLESWSESLTTCHKAVVIEGYLALTMVLVQDQNRN
ncbi:Uncharacterized protein Fot_28718 [Forsythia ovata]|uniref:Uncharacterized protein n=1 Tax=Forsythia ovata TaxID=205694 RepID=A0ABD1TPW6_9LAMI